LKIIFLSTSDIGGGAARATYWLAKGLQNNGQEVSMCVHRKYSDFPWVWKVARRKIENIFNLARPYFDAFPLFFYRKRKSVTWTVNLLPNSKLIDSVNKLNPDIINLHWIGEGFVSISQLSKFDKPIVWSLYDMWPFTGGCHYDASCGRYTEGCGSCPELQSGIKDLSSFVIGKKLKHWKNIPITVVAPSRWLAREAKKSILFRDKRVEVIPHGTNLDLFKPIDKCLAKDILGLDKDKRYVLFGSTAGIGDIRKGYQFLKPALIRLASKYGFDDVCLIIFGESEPIVKPNLGFPIQYIGRLSDDISLAVLYSAADVTVTPSMQEAFGMTASESMSCGTPVVAFAVSGPLDVIDHKLNGYLATPYDIEDFSDGIAWILEKDRIQNLSLEARKKCENNFSLTDVARQYENLYNDLIKEHKRKFDDYDNSSGFYDFKR
jgi:glycosyltransferase involved in cell wall biosynthesis